VAHQHLLLDEQRICVISSHAVEAQRDGDEILLLCTRCLEPWRTPIDTSVIMIARHVCDDETV